MKPSASLLREWDDALKRALPAYYGMPASPQVLFRIKRDIVRIMRDEHRLNISAVDAARVRLEWLAGKHAPNLIVPPNLLARTLH